MKSYIDKATSDPFYSETYKYLGKNSLAPAGFLYDRNSTDKSLLEIEQDNFFFSSLNVNKIIKNIDALSKDQIENIRNQKKCYTLLSTGSFNPIHEGHIKMMDLAAERLKESGVVVVGGYLSPSHDKYVFTKDERFKISASQRILLCEKLINNHQLLSTDSWESMNNDAPINFTDVILRTKWLLNKTLELYLMNKVGIKISIEIAYVFGSDNYTFMDTFIESGVCVCVPRRLEDTLKCENKKKSIAHFNLNNVNSRILLSSVGQSISSTQIRNYDSSIKVVASMGSSLPYFIRDDAEFCTNFLINKMSDYPIKISKLKDEIFNLFTSIFEKLVILNVEDQANNFKNPMNYSVINLDTWASVSNEYKLRVSRVFNISDGQIYSSNLFIENKKQLQGILNSKFEEYVLVDDDIATGFTVKSIEEKLYPKKCIAAISLNKQKQFNDIVDIRDFIFGAKYGGLMCLNPYDKTMMRVPYVYPFINLHSRAKIPFTHELEFSKKIIEINLNFFMYTGLKISDLDIYFQKFCQYLNIPIETPIYTMLRRFYQTLE